MAESMKSLKVHADELAALNAKALRAERKAEQDMEGGTVYVIAAIGTPYVKIGHTNGIVANRLAELQVGCPMKLEHIASWPGGVGCEAFLHDMLTRWQLHVRGEWFMLDYEGLQDTDGRPAAQMGWALANGLAEEQGGWEEIGKALKARLTGSVGG